MQLDIDLVVAVLAESRDDVTGYRLEDAVFPGGVCLHIADFLEQGDRRPNIAFPDHHPYTPADIDRLKSALQSTGSAVLLTTEKDAVRLGSLTADLPVRTVPLRAKIENEPAAIEWLLNHL